MAVTPYYELYRRSTVGTTLIDALDVLILDEKIQPQLAMKILNNFDKIISTHLKSDSLITKSRLTFKGNLDVYRFCDEVWTFVIKNVSIKASDLSRRNDSVTSNNFNIDLELFIEKFKIVACNSKRVGDT